MRLASGDTRSGLKPAEIAAETEIPPTAEDLVAYIKAALNVLGYSATDRLRIEVVPGETLEVKIEIL